MVARIATVAFQGIEVVEVDVQVRVDSGFVNFLIVGLADKAVAESRERVRGAFAGIGLALPPKRIIVNLDTQMLVAYDNGEEIFRWYISSGVSNAPTSPGVYQILNHDERAYGSSNTLCDSAGIVCGQWEMNWFMGIYEVIPGLVNGFHGAVLLPNGNYLGGGNVGAPYTFGCVMSSDENARMLYEWADVGTIVEIISWEFPPQSDLGRLAATNM